MCVGDYTLPSATTTNSMYLESSNTIVVLGGNGRNLYNLSYIYNVQCTMCNSKEFHVYGLSVASIMHVTVLGSNDRNLCKIHVQASLCDFLASFVC